MAKSKEGEDLINRNRRLIKILAQVTIAAWAFSNCGEKEALLPQKLRDDKALDF